MKQKLPIILALVGQLIEATFKRHNLYNLGAVGLIIAISTDKEMPDHIENGLGFHNYLLLKTFNFFLGTLFSAYILEVIFDRIQVDVTGTFASLVMGYFIGMLIDQLIKLFIPVYLSSLISLKARFSL